jgi:hypothetical protein
MASAPLICMVMERRRIPCSGSSCSEPCGGKSTVVVERETQSKKPWEKTASHFLSHLYLNIHFFFSPVCLWIAVSLIFQLFGGSQSEMGTRFSSLINFYFHLFLSDLDDNLEKGERHHKPSLWWWSLKKKKNTRKMKGRLWRGGKKSKHHLCSVLVDIKSAQ